MNILSLNNQILQLNYNSTDNIIYLSKCISNKYTMEHLEIDDNSILNILDTKYYINKFKLINDYKYNSYLDNIITNTIIYDKVIISYKINKNNNKEIVCIKYNFPKKNSHDFLLSLSDPITQIDDNVFIGNLVGAIDKKLLDSKNIKNIVHVFEDDLDSYNFNNISFKINDDINENIEKYLIDFKEFLNKCLGNIFVHCQHGSSRSGSFIIYYLMIKYNLSFENALFFAKFKRNGICPNEGFVKSLKKLKNK